jgi:dipeptidyl-peptidase 4
MNPLKAAKRGMIVAGALFAGLTAMMGAQDRLPHYPGYEQYQKMAGSIRQSVIRGALDVTWEADGRSVVYRWGGKGYRYDIRSRKATVVELPAEPEGRRPGSFRRRGGGEAVGYVRLGQELGGGGIVRRQRSEVPSPDGKTKAFTRAGNLWLSAADGSGEIQVTTAGNEAARLRFGVATLIYGEELGMGEGIFWSADSSRFAYYGFDESRVPDYPVLLNQVDQYAKLENDPYPKAGVTSPEVSLHVYDLKTGRSIPVDVRDGKPFADSALGYYVYRVYWSHDGSELYFQRMNRKQNTLEFVAADPSSGRCRVLVHEEWPAGWVEWSPAAYFLGDGRRFIWASERSGFRNYDLYDLNGTLLVALSRHNGEVDEIVRVDEKKQLLYYMARDGDNHMKRQLHRVGLDGRNERRLTDPSRNHDISFSPDGRYFIDIAQTHDVPPVTTLRDADGRALAELARSDMTKFAEMGLKPVELLSFTAADGRTELHGLLHFPSNFDPSRRYPLLVSVYGGPLTNAARESFVTPNALCEYGFLVAEFDARSAGQRGKKFLDAFYGHLGIIEMDDQAAGVRALLARPYIDGRRIGIFGTSYGGTAAATCLLRFPDLFRAACASSPVTDYRNYNNIYGERYLGLVSENKAGYDAAMVMSYVGNLKGRLLLYYGTADNNVHPANSLQLIQALQKAGKNFELQVGPDQGHTSINQARMMEFFIENLVLADAE